MSDNKDIITFENSGLNTDADILALPKGDSRYRLNVVLSDDGSHYVLTPIKGNTLKTFTFTGGGTYSIAGTVEDKENNALIYFVYDSSVNNYHSIIRYNYSLDTFTEILRDQPALFDSSFNGIVDAGIIGNEDDQFLVWADGSYPKMINIAYAIASGYSTTITEDELRFYKKGYTGNISTTVDLIGTETNNIKRKIFQFSIRFKYYDKTFSTISPYSTIPVYDDNIANGRVSDEIIFNAITLDMDFDVNPNTVDSLQVLYRIVDIGEGAPGSWYIYDNFDYTATGAYSVDFYNEKSIGSVDDTEANRPYDYVPDQSNHVGLIDSNRAVFDVKLEGYDNIIFPSGEEPSVTVNEDAGSHPNNGLTYEQTRQVDNVTPGTFTYTEAEGVDSDWVLSIVDTAGTPAVHYGQTFSSFGLNEDDVFSKIEDYINNETDVTITAAYVSGTNTLTVSSSSYVIDVNLFVLSNDVTLRVLRSKATYKYGIRYGYSGKVGFVQSDDGFSFETTGNDLATGSDTNYEFDAWVTLKHQAPIGATDYQIVSFGNNIRAAEEYFVYFNSADITDDGTSYTIFTDDSNTVIKRDDIVNRMTDAYGGSIDYGLDLVVGDEIRFVAAWENPQLDTTLYPSPYLFDTEHVYEIIAVDDTEIRISSSALDSIIKNYPTSATEQGYLLIEIRSKKSNLDAVAQEFSPVYPISNRNHLGIETNDIDQVYNSVDAVLRVTDVFADCWKTTQTFVNDLNRGSYGLLSNFHLASSMEHGSVSLYYDSFPSFQGRANVVNEFSEQRSYNKIRWGGKYLDESGANFLITFDSDDERDLDDRNGLINKIEQIGDTLKVYQERKVTSFYLKTTSSTDAQGNNTYVFSDQVMSEGRQSMYDYGCTNFESYVKNVRNAYFFDVINAYVVRDSPAGLEPISDYGMHTFFKEKSAQILALGRENVKVLGTFDDDNELYIISFIYSTMTNDVVESVSFHEPSNKWGSHFTLPSTVLDYYGRISGQTYISFLSGQLYTHNSNNLRCNFWGSQYGSEVRVHSNINPNLMKVWDSIGIMSTGQWTPSTNGDVKVTIPTEQQSRLKAGKFELQEGEYRSEFLRDMLSGESTPQENNLFNGDDLRGYEVSVNLRNSDTDEANLRMVKINGTTST